MKTNVMLKSKDRELFSIVIKQETKTGFLSVSQLQDSYDVARAQYGWSERYIKTVMQTDSFKERVFYILDNQGLIKGLNSNFTEDSDNQEVVKANIPTFTEDSGNQEISSFVEDSISIRFHNFIKAVEKDGIAKTLKNLNVWKTTGRGDNKSTFCNPYIWVLLAMELNPMIYGKVVIWLTDSLIFDRVEAGDEFKQMNSSIKRIIEEPDYSKYATAINNRVFGKHESGMRNLASASELKQIAKIESSLSDNIEMGYITNDEQIMSFIEKTRLVK